MHQGIQQCDKFIGIKPHGDNSVCISAKSGEGLEALKEKIVSVLDKEKVHLKLLLPYSRAGLVDSLNREASVISCEYRNEGIEIEFSADRAFCDRILADRDIINVRI